MRFDNETPFPARLFRTVIDERRLSASVVARVTCDFHGGAVVPSADQPWIVSPEPWRSPHGEVEQDQVFRKGGVDVHVFGSAHARGGLAAPSIQVRVAVGGVERRALVSGERVWQRQGGALVPSAPARFASLPLALEDAYGGEVEIDGLRVAWPDNPRGRGFYAGMAAAEGQPLPRIEDADHAVTRWDDHPPVVGFGFCPYGSPARLAAAIVEKGGALERVTSRLYNTAFPNMVFPSAKAGDEVRLGGVSPEGDIVLAIPEHGLFARLTLGDEALERPLVLEQIGVEVEARRVFFGYRFPFRYVMHPLQKRLVALGQRGR